MVLRAGVIVKSFGRNSTARYCDDRNGFQCHFVLLLGECAERNCECEFFVSHFSLANLGRCHVDTAAKFFMCESI